MFDRIVLGKGSTYGSSVVFLVEDDSRLSALVGEYLQSEGYSVTIIPDGSEAAAKIPAEQPDLVILDVMLPGMDGFEVCRSIRPAYSGPILMMTARDDEVDEILGLEIGADDYLTKPVRPRVLLSRVKALLRRSTQDSVPNNGAMNFGDLRVDIANRRVEVADTVIHLTTAELDLLQLLAEHAGETMSRDQLSRSLRGIDYDGLDRTIDLRVARLRKKIELNPSQPRYILSVRGAGYMLPPEPDCG
ncbi:response regulator [Oceaniferula spumae]|uniref:response regulator n=1 Tax=Oceaniferula spumae TaxID=2979115 RepID=UPI003F4EBD31